MQLLIHGSQVILSRFQYPIGHGLPAQMDAPPVNLLLLPVQRTSHNKLLGHDMGNGFRCGKAAGDDVLLSGSLYNRSLTAFVSTFTTALAGIGVIDMLLHDSLRRDDLEFINYLGTDLSHGFAALGAYQVLTFQTVLYLLNSDMDPTSKITWLILISVVPTVGAPLYFYVQANRLTEPLKNYKAVITRYKEGVESGSEEIFASAMDFSEKEAYSGYLCSKIASGDL